MEVGVKVGMEVRKGAKVSYRGVYGETIVGVVVGFGGTGGTAPLVMSSGDFVKGWMHGNEFYKLFDTVGGIQIDIPVKADVYYYVSMDRLKVLGYE